MIWAEISTGVVTALRDRAEAPTSGGTWVEAPEGVGLNWTYVAGVFTSPDGHPPSARPAREDQPSYLLTGPQWVERFTDTEWGWLKLKRAEDSAAGRRLDQMMDAIRWTNSIDVNTANMDEFYDWLVAQGLPGGQTRVDELRQAV